MPESDGSPDSNGGGAGRGGHLLLVWSPSGYTLREREGDPPPVGHELEQDGATLVITKIGPSPFPGDPRPCAFSMGK